MEGEIEFVRKMLTEAKELGAKYALLGNPSHVQLASEAGLAPIGDFRLNVTNAASLEMWHGAEVHEVMLSPELTSKQVRRLEGRAIVYGRLPLMITERCFMKENFGCDKCGRCQLVDRKGIKFPMVREYDHRNLIFNSAYTYMGDRPDEAAGLSYHFVFTTETSSDAVEIVRSFKEKRAFPLVGQFRRMGKRKVD